MGGSRAAAATARALLLALGACSTLPFYCDERSTTICVVLGLEKSSTYSGEYASGFSGPAASHLVALPSPRHEGNVGQAPSESPLGAATSSVPTHRRTERRTGCATRKNGPRRFAMARPQQGSDARSSSHDCP
jgi:hypothetical protein